MNQFFLLIPAVNESDAGQDIAYLKLLGDISTENVIDIFRNVKVSMRLIEEEDFEIIYDHRHLRTLNRVIRAKHGNDDASNEMPQIENLLIFLNDAKSLQDIKSGKLPITVNGMRVEEGLVNAYIESEKEHNILLNKGALNNELQPIEVEAAGDKVNLIPLECNAVDVYLWLVDHRFPVRKLDSNYKKHTENEKFGKKGVRISPISYTVTQLEAFLKKALRASKGARELYFKDNEHDKIVVFWDENLETQSYHAFEIAADDLQEIQKMNKRGGRNLIHRLEEIAKL